jgi:hypothetical protein
VNVRTQLARLGVDDGELLFDSQSERMVLHAMPRTKNIRRFCRFTQIICEKNPLLSAICRNLRNLWTNSGEFAQ